MLVALIVDGSEYDAANSAKRLVKSRPFGIGVSSWAMCMRSSVVWPIADTTTRI